MMINTQLEKKQGRRMSWDEFHPDVKTYFDNIESKKMEDSRVKRYYDSIRQHNIRRINSTIDSKITQIIPEIKLTQRFIEQANYVANKTTDTFSHPTEVSGVCTGRKTKSGIYLDQFHVFHNQSCNSIRTTANGFGMIQTYQEQTQKNRQVLSQGHSHNVMATFHSPEDNDLLKQGITESYMEIEQKVDNLSIPLQCFYNVVFNQDTAIDSGKRDQPHIKMIFRKPRANLQGKWEFENTPHTYEPKWKMLPYKPMSEEDKRRLDVEVEERVRYLN